MLTEVEESKSKKKLYLKSDNVNNVTLALIWNEC